MISLIGLHIDALIKYILSSVRLCIAMISEHHGASTCMSVAMATITHAILILI